MATTDKHSPITPKQQKRMIKDKLKEKLIKFEV